MGAAQIKLISVSLSIVVATLSTDCYVALQNSSSALNRMTTGTGRQNVSDQPENPPMSDDGNTIEDSTSSQVELEQFWLNQRDQFFNQTSFNLTRRTANLVGQEYDRTYHLPFWFDYVMFMNLTDRSQPDASLLLKRHHIYIDNCVHIWKHNALKRLHRPNNYTFIDHAEDWTQFENYNEEWNEIDLNLTSVEKHENPVAKAIRLVQDELKSCTMRRDKNLCILLLIDLEERFGPSMKLRYPFEEERYRSLLDLDAAEEAAAEFTDSIMSADGKFSYWLDRREQFFRNNSFVLTEKAKKLIGSPEYSNRIYHLPFWFDYEVFKRMVGRINETPQEELKSHHKYIDGCLEIWNETASERLGQLDYEAGGITSHVDIPARTCLYNCNPFDYELTEEETKDAPTERALRMVQEELDSCADRRRIILLLVELEEKFDFPRARGMRYPFEPERTHEDFWRYIEERDKAIANFVKSLD